jgi:ankyrin repeat protein
MKAFTLTILCVASFFACAPSRTTTQPQANASPDATAPNEVTESQRSDTYDECAEWQRIIGRLCSKGKTSEGGCTALMHAAAHGQLNSVRALLKSGADVNKKDEVGFSALMLAARQGNHDVVKTLLDAGGDPNAAAGVAHVGRWSVLTMAMSRCNRNRILLVDTLIAAGAKLNPPKDDPITPLNHAIEQTDLEMIQAVLQRGAEVNRTEDFGKTPLTTAVSMGDPNVAVVKLLLAAGADPNPPKLRVGGDGQRMSLLAYLESYIEGSRRDGRRDEAREEIARLLKQAGAKR